MENPSFLKIQSKKGSKQKKVLFALIELYIETGKAIGSQTLKETLFSGLSSATLRNYFADLEEEGYLAQPHTSSGRIPTAKAFNLYAKEIALQFQKDATSSFSLKDISSKETKAIHRFIQEACDLLCKKSGLALFFSLPQFDQDFLHLIKLIKIESKHLLAILITDFGVIQTENLYIEEPLSSFSLKRIEDYFYLRLHGNKNSPEIPFEEEPVAKLLYNELIIRFLARYSHYSEEEMYRTGFSELLLFPEFQEREALSRAFSFFENEVALKKIVQETLRAKQLEAYIGEVTISSENTEIKTPSEMALLSIPYFVANHPVGCVTLLGPLRIPYKKLIPLLKEFSEELSKSLTQTVYKFKISYREPFKRSCPEIQGKDFLMLS